MEVQQRPRQTLTLTLVLREIEAAAFDTFIAEVDQLRSKAQEAEAQCALALWRLLDRHLAKEE